MKLCTANGKFQLLRHLPIVALFFFTVLCGAIGVDIRWQWDEPVAMDSIQRTLHTGEMLPLRYQYPSFDYTIGLIRLAPEIAIRSIAKGMGIAMEPLGKNPQELFFILRRFFCEISMLSLFWTYALVLLWRKRWGEAFLAASLLGLSWEVGYHARWIVPNTILMQFGILTTLFMLLSLQAVSHDRSRTWLMAAAITAGIACSTKYPGGLLLLGVLLAGILHVHRWRAGGARRKANGALLWGRVALLALGLTILFTLGYLAFTPGTLLDTPLFLKHVREVFGDYSRGYMYYKVAPGFEHAILMMLYFLTDVASVYGWISVVVFLLALLGIGDAVRKHDTTAAILFFVPVLYAAFFITRSTMAVRNFMFLVPFFTILAARGWTSIYEHLPRFPSAKQAMLALTFLLCSVNALWLFHAALTVQAAPAENLTREFLAYTDSHPEERYWVSQKLLDALKKEGAAPDHRFTRDSSAHFNSAVFFSKELATYRLANRFQPTVKVIGPEDVNTDYYPGWQGWNRIVIVPSLLFRHYLILFNTL